MNKYFMIRVSYSFSNDFTIRKGRIVVKKLEIFKIKKTQELLCNWKKGLRIAGAVCCLSMATAAFMGNSIPVQAVTMTVKQGEETKEWTGKKVVTQIDGKTITMDNATGIVVNDTYMVPYEEVFEDYLEVNCTYSESAKTLTLEANGEKVKLTVDSDIAYANDVKWQMQAAPFWGIAGEKEKLYVPAEFVAEKLKFGFSIKTIKEDTDTINILVPFQLKKEEETVYITGNTIEKLIFNNKTLSLISSIPGIQWNEKVYIPCSILKKSPIYAKINETDEAVTINRAGHELIFYQDSNLVEIEGKEQEIEQALLKVEYKGNTDYMVPAELVFDTFGANSTKVNVNQKKITVKKSGGTYLSLSTKPKNTNGNYIKKIVAKNSNKKDMIQFTCKKTPNISVKSTSKKITLTIKNVSVNQGYTEKGLDARYTNSITVKKSGSNVVCTLNKQSGKNFMYQYGNGKVRVIVGATPIRIAVDCGHGSNTPGKRSPKMPCNIDFEGDGIIDVKKGQSIREHQGNVGVGKFLAKELERCGFYVYRSAFGSADISLSGRQKNIKAHNCKYSISVHFNAAGNGKTFNKASGVEVYYHKDKASAKSSKSMAAAVLKEMAKGTKQLNRGVKTMSLALCNAKTMGTQGSILVECAFMTNLHEAKTMFGNQGYWRETAKEIAKAMCDYCGVSYIAE